MRIGIDITTLQDKYFSGISEYTYNLLNELFVLDKTNEYVLYYNSFRNVKINFQNDVKNVNFYHSRYPNKFFNYFLQKSLRYPQIDRLIGGVDVFFSPHLNFYSLSGKCRKVITIHDVSFLRYKEFFSLRKNFWHYMINIKKLLSRYDKIIAVSENTKNDLIELCSVPATKIEVVYSGIDKNLRKVDKTDELDIGFVNHVKTKYDLPNDFIFYLGNIEPRKNIETIIQAFDLLINKKTHPNLFLVIAGAKCWKSSRIMNTWKKAINKDKIKFLGYVEKNDKKYLYSLARLFVYPSFYEGFGFPPLEAISCDCPTIIGANSSLTEIVGKRSISVDSFNVNSLAISMDELLSKQKQQSYVNDFNANIKEKFTWKNAALKTLNIIVSS